jgi:hypothetical protein
MAGWKHTKKKEGEFIRQLCIQNGFYCQYGSNMTSFVQKAIETGKHRNWCMSYGCTTCGANNFRNRIYGYLKTALGLSYDRIKYNFDRDALPLADGSYDPHEVRMVAPWDELSPIENRVIFEKLINDMKGAKLNTYDYEIFHAMRLVIMELHDRNAETAFGNSFEYYLGESDFGKVLAAMRSHYAEGKQRYLAHLERQHIDQYKK